MSLHRRLVCCRDEGAGEGEAARRARTLQPRRPRRGPAAGSRRRLQREGQLPRHHLTPSICDVTGAPSKAVIQRWRHHHNGGDATTSTFHGYTTASCEICCFGDAYHATLSRSAIFRQRRHPTTIWVRHRVALSHNASTAEYPRAPLVQSGYVTDTLGGRGPWCACAVSCESNDHVSAAAHSLRDSFSRLWCRPRRIADLDGFSE